MSDHQVERLAKLIGLQKVSSTRGNMTASLIASTGWPCGLRGNGKGYWLFATAGGHIIFIQ